MKITKAFAMRISKILSERKMSKYALEKKSGISHSALRHIFNENNSDINFSTVIRVVEAFNMTISEFFDDGLFNLENLIYPM